MLPEDLCSLIPQDEIAHILVQSVENGNEYINEVDILDYIFNAEKLELRPRVYTGDYANLMWCVEIIDWKEGFNVTTLTGYATRREAIHEALLWFYTK
jgi:hypothetical protein